MKIKKIKALPAWGEVSCDGHEWAVSLMETRGGPGAGLAMAAENLFPPIPSEVILPLAGFTASRGELSLARALAWTTSGSLVGALVLYGLGGLLGGNRLRRYLRLTIETLKVGSVGTLHTLGLAKEQRARYLLASTGETYGDPRVHPQPESYWGHVNSVGPRGVYDEAKRFGEALTMAYRRAHGVDTSIVRIFKTFGPRMRPDDGRAIPAFITAALDGRPIPVADDGSQTRSVCYVDNLVEGVLRLLRSPLAGPVNLGNPTELRVLELAERIRRLCDSSSPIVFVPGPEDDPTVRQPDITLARTTLGREPQMAVKEGLRRSIAWFRDRRLRHAGEPAPTARICAPAGRRS